jgi:hypothetical protein
MALFPIIIGRPGKTINTRYAGNIIKIQMLYFIMKKRYNIGKKELAFYVNMANICTDIILEIYENCT